MTPPAGLDVGMAAQNVVRGDGQGRVMLEMARAVLARGHRVTVYAHRLDDELRQHADFVEIPIAPGPQIVDDVVSAWRITRLMRRARHNIVCVLGPTAFPPPPYVFDAHFSQRGWRRSWTPATRPRLRHRLHAHAAQLMEARCARRASVILTSTVQLAEEIVGEDDPRVVVVPKGVDLDEFRPATVAERAAARAQLDVPEDRFVAGFLGEYTTTRKGLEPLLRAMALRPQGEHLLVAGRGPRDRLVGRLDELGLGDRVTIAGFAPAPVVLAAVDAQVVASSYEPYSLVALEAAATATPVVLSALAGVGPLLGEGALIVEHPHEPAELRSALDRLIDDPDLVERTAAAGRRAAVGLSWERTMDLAAAAIEQAGGWTGARP